MSIRAINSLQSEACVILGLETNATARPQQQHVLIIL